MDFIKKAVDGKMEKIIDRAAVVAKEKIGAMFGGEEEKAEVANEQKAEAGVGDLLSDAIGQVTDTAANKAAEQLRSFGKSLFK